MNKNFNNPQEVREYLRNAILSNFPSQAAYARWEAKKSKNGFTTQRLSAALTGNLPIPQFVLDRFYIRREVTETWRVEKP